MTKIGMKSPRGYDSTHSLPGQVLLNQQDPVLKHHGSPPTANRHEA